MWISYAPEDSATPPVAAFWAIAAPSSGTTDEVRKTRNWLSKTRISMLNRLPYSVDTTTIHSFSCSTADCRNRFSTPTSAMLTATRCSIRVLGDYAHTIITARAKEETADGLTIIWRNRKRNHFSMQSLHYGLSKRNGIQKHAYATSGTYWRIDLTTRKCKI